MLDSRYDVPRARIKLRNSFDIQPVWKRFCDRFAAADGIKLSYSPYFYFDLIVAMSGQDKQNLT